jgi:hypothetical protein
VGTGYRDRLTTFAGPVPAATLVHQLSQSLNAHDAHETHTRHTRRDAAHVRERTDVAAAADEASRIEVVVVAVGG